MKYLCMFLAAVLIAVLGVGAFIISDYRKIEKAWVASVKEWQEADLALGRAKTRIGDANQHIDELEQKVKDEIEAHDATLSMYAELKAKYDSRGGGTTIITLPGEVVEVPVALNLPDYHFFYDSPELGLVDIGVEIPYDYQDYHLKFHGLLTTKDGVPVQQSEYELHIEVGGYFVQAIQPDGSVAHYAFLYEIRPESEQTEKLPFTLSKFHVVLKDHRSPNFRWAPHVDIGGAVGSSLGGNLISGVSLGISGWGYGKSTNDLLVRFPRLAAVVNTDYIVAELDPVVFNVGEPLPIVSDIWMGPGIIWNPSGFGLVLSIGSVL